MNDINVGDKVLYTNIRGQQYKIMMKNIVIDKDDVLAIIEE